MLYSCGRGSICKSVFVCQVLCTGIQGIYALLVGCPAAKVCSSAKFCVLVFKASLLNFPQVDPSAKYVHLSSVVYWCWRHLSSISRGVHLPKSVHLPSSVYWYSRHLCSIMWNRIYLPKCVCLPSVVYWNSRHLCSICGGSICQSVFICQVLSTIIQGIYAMFWGVLLQGDLPGSAFTTILHIKPGKYEPS